VIGDQGKANDDQEAVAQGLAAVAAERNPLFIAGVGDNVYSHRASILVERWIDIYMGFPALKRDWFMITGNHDYRGPNMATRQREFTLHADNIQHGGHWKMPAFWYKRSFQTASGVTVDTFFIDSMVWDGEDGDSSKETQRAWLEDQLSNSNAVWKVVFGHHPIYTKGNQIMKRVLFEELEPMMRTYGVQMYVCGHSHNKQFIQHRGLNYIVSGAGHHVNSFVQDDYPLDSPPRLYSLTLGFAGLSICDSSQAVLTYYMEDGQVDQEFTLTADRPESEPEPHVCTIRQECNP
jgi:acid phosphatase